MAREARITQQEVNAICEKLRSQGKRPSTRTIRSEHGAGSTATIQGMLRVWQESNPEAVDTVTLMPVLLKALQDNMQHEVSRARQELHEKLAAAEETSGDLARDAEQLADENAALEEANGQLMDSMAELKGQIQQLTEDLATARGVAQKEREDAERLRVELAKAELRIEQGTLLIEQHANVQRELATERERRQVADTTASVTATQRDAQAERLAEERTRTAQLTEQLEKLGKGLTSAAVRFEAAHGRMEGADRELTEAKASLAAERERTAKAKAEAAEWKGHVQELRSQIAASGLAPNPGDKKDRG